MSKTLTESKAALQALIRTNMQGLKVSALLIDRTKTVMELIEPFQNDELLDAMFVDMLVDTFTSNPQAMFNGSVIQDGVMYPEIMDEEQTADILEQVKAMCEMAGPEGAANIAFVSQVTGEIMLEFAA